MKGISQVIEAILVLIIAISLVSIFYLWSFGSTSSTQESLEKNLGQKEGCLKIENIDIANKKIAIRNCGENDLSDFVVYLDDAPTASYSGKLSPGNITQIGYSQDISLGDHDIKVSSDYAESSVITFSISQPPSQDTVPPTYFNNIFANVTNNTAVNIGKAIKISTQWTDNVQLSLWVNSSKINNTGSWVNNTTWSSFSSGNWSNFTIVYPSTASGGNLSIKIFANDTSDNENVTSTLFWYNVTPDTTPPTWFQNSTNSTTAGKHIRFNINWTDNVQVDKALTSLWNGSTWINASSWCSIGAASGWCNQTMVVNSTPQKLWWKVYANDTSNNWNTSQNFSLVTSACDFNIFSLPFTISNSDSLYCLAQDVYIGGQNAINFSSGVHNTTLDCQGYNIDGNDASGAQGIYLTGSNTKNNTIKNCNITDFYNGIRFFDNPENNTILNNSIESNTGSCIHISLSKNITFLNNICKFNSGGGIGIYSSNYSFVKNNTFLNNGYAVYMDSSNYVQVIDNVVKFNDHGISVSVSNNVNVSNNIFNSNNYGIDIMGSPSINFNFTGGSIYNNTVDFHLENNGVPAEGDITYYFRNTNFTGQRKTYLGSDVKSLWFAYNNETTGNIWHYTRLPLDIYTNIYRTLININQTLIKWLDNSSVTVTATYNITGLLTYTNYSVYNNSALLTYGINSSSNGKISFAINLPANQNISITVNESTAVAPSPPVMWLNFNEANGTRTYDSSGNGNNGTFSGESFNDGTLYGATRVDGIFEKALNFDGSNDYIQVPNSNELNPDYITVSAWIFPKTDKLLVDSGGMIVKKLNWSGYQGYFMQWNNISKRVEFNIGNGTKWSTAYSLSNSVPINKWTYVTGTYDGSYIRVYINGTFNVSIAMLGTVASSPDNLRIGAETSSYKRFNGTIDEVRIWNRNLSEIEIQAEMISSIPISRPVATWSFEEPTAATYVNDTHIWIKGKYGSALSFDGINDYITIPDSTDFNIADEMTISAWIYPLINQSTGGSNQIINRLNYATSQGFYLREGYGTTSYHKPGFYVGNGTNSTGNCGSSCWMSAYYSTPLTPNNWYFITGTVKANDKIRLYINGSLVGENNFLGIINQTTGSIRIGYEGSGKAFNGTIDEVRIWDRVLSQSEIQDEMDVG